MRPGRPDTTNPTGTNVATQPLSTFRATGTPPHQTAGGQAEPQACGSCGTAGPAGTASTYRRTPGR